MRLEEKPKVGTDGLTSPRSCSVGAMRMLRLERTGEKLMRMVALCADVEEAELEQVAVVEEVVRRVAVVDGELSRSPMVRSRTGSRGRTRKRHGGGVTETTPEMKTATRRGSRRESMPQSTQTRHRATHPRVCQTRECIGGDGTHRCCQDRTCEGECTTKTPLSEGPAEKASTTVAGAEERRGRRCRCSPQLLE